jgi:hypothetical protein
MRRHAQVITLRLERPADMFEMPQTDLFSEYRNFLTGVDYCLSELRSRPLRLPVRVEIELPPQELDAGVEGRLQRTLRRYCEYRIAYNLRERRATRFDGLSALVVGLPIAAAGLAIALAVPLVLGTGGNTTTVVDTLGWVLAWVGLWFPLDSLVFTPIGYIRETRALRRLARADLVIVPRLLP